MCRSANYCVEVNGMLSTRNKAPFTTSSSRHGLHNQVFVAVGDGSISQFLFGLI